MDHQEMGSYRGPNPIVGYCVVLTSQEKNSYSSGLHSTRTMMPWIQWQPLYDFLPKKLVAADCWRTLSLQQTVS